jgi:hypothetical protein
MASDRRERGHHLVIARSGATWQSDGVIARSGATWRSDGVIARSGATWRSHKIKEIATLPSVARNDTAIAQPVPSEARNLLRSSQ